VKNERVGLIRKENCLRPCELRARGRNLPPGREEKSSCGKQGRELLRGSGGSWSKRKNCGDERVSPFVRRSERRSSWEKKRKKKQRFGKENPGTGGPGDVKEVCLRKRGKGGKKRPSEGGGLGCMCVPFGQRESSQSGWGEIHRFGGRTRK